MNLIAACVCFTGLSGTFGLAWSHGASQPGVPAPADAKHREQKPWGVAGDARDVRRTIVVRMDDRMRFNPDLLQVQEGETVRLAISNRGRLLHELVIGTREELAAHAALMQKFPGMEHDEPFMAHVPAGSKGSIVWTFNRPGEFEFACLVAGHFAAGMKGRIRVIARTPSRPS